MLNIFNSHGGGLGRGTTGIEGPAGHVPGEWPGLAVGHPLRIKKINTSQQIN